MTDDNEDTKREMAHNRLDRPIRIGIVGGLGPKTGFRFCLDLNNRFKAITGCQPDLILHNVPVTAGLEEGIVSGRSSKGWLALLRGSVVSLNGAGADLIVIPCNTVHAFMAELRAASRTPIISIIEEIGKECERRGIRTAGILASAGSIKEGFHLVELSRAGIRLVVPDGRDQEEINRLILRIISSGHTGADKEFLLGTVSRLADRGAEAVILGCTDLHEIISERDCRLPVIDSLKVLEDSALMALQTREWATLGNESPISS